MTYSTDTRTRTLELLIDIVERFEGEVPFQNVSDTEHQSLEIVEAMARRVGLLEGQPGDMATVTRSIGTGGRDYSTITSWEADLDNGATYSSGDDAVGEMYNDSAFDENVVINGGTTVGLNSTTLTVASGERHDGTAGTGARLSVTANNRRIETVSGGIARTIEWLEYDGNGNDPGDPALELAGSPACARNVIAHQITSSSGAHDATFVTRSGQLKVLNSIFYDALETATGTAVNAGFEVVGTSAIEVKNVTIHDIRNEGGSGTVYGIQFTDSVNADLRNCLVTDVTGTTSGSISCFNVTSPSSATVDYCASSDTSASGANSLTNIASADQYVSTVKGSEDLHLKTGADAIGEGVDLGTTDGVNIDIDGRDRDAEGDVWDIGADQFVSAGGPDFTLSADAGSFSLSGIDASLLANRTIQANNGAFAVAGQNADLLANRVLTASEGAFTLTGISVDLVYSGAGGPTYTLTADQGSFLLSGQNAPLLASRMLATENGSFTLTGVNVDLRRGYSMTAEVGSFALDGQDASLLANRALTADAGSFVLTGIDASLIYSGQQFAELIVVSSASISTASASGSISVANATGSITVL